MNYTLKTLNNNTQKNPKNQIILEINWKTNLKNWISTTPHKKSRVKPQLNLIKFYIRPNKVQYKLASGNDFDTPHNTPEPWAQAAPLA